MINLEDMSGDVAQSALALLCDEPLICDAIARSPPTLWDASFAAVHWLHMLLVSHLGGTHATALHNITRIIHCRLQCLIADLSRCQGVAPSDALLCGCCELYDLCVALCVILQQRVQELAQMPAVVMQHGAGVLAQPSVLAFVRRSYKSQLRASRCPNTHSSCSADTDSEASLSGVLSMATEGVELCVGAARRWKGVALSCDEYEQRYTSTLQKDSQ